MDFLRVAKWVLRWVGLTDDHAVVGWVAQLVIVTDVTRAVQEIKSQQ